MHSWFSETSLMEDSETESQRLLNNKYRVERYTDPPLEEDEPRSFSTSEDRRFVLTTTAYNSKPDLAGTSLGKYGGPGKSREDLYTNDGILYNRALSVGDQIERIMLSWNNIHVHVKPDGGGKCCGGKQEQLKHILRGVSGVVEPGSLLAIMGASGAGKTTLLNVLTGRNNGRLITAGDVRVNGHEIGRDMPSVSAYVQQDDLFIGTLTVKEHLWFQSVLRMDDDIPLSVRKQRVHDVINELGLRKCADTYIGIPGQLKGISGGEKKRLSFASEVLTNPPLMFCDEPTSGLDSSMAETVVQTLKQLTNRGKTVICTIHQPSSQVYNMFDRLMLMAEGKVAFLGDASKALNFFSDQGYKCPLNFNPSDYFIHILAIRPSQHQQSYHKLQSMTDYYERSSHCLDVKNRIENTEFLDDQSLANLAHYKTKSRYKANVFYQFYALFWRSFASAYRDKRLFSTKVVQVLIVALVLSVSAGYLNAGSYDGATSINGVMFICQQHLSWTPMFLVILIVAAVLGLSYGYLGNITSNHITGIDGALFSLLAELSWGPMFMVLLYTTTLVSLIYFQTVVNEQGVQNINGCLYWTIMNATFSNMYMVIGVFPVEMPIFMREHQNGMYRPSIYFLCKTIAEIPLFMLLPFILTTTVYWMVGLYPDAVSYLIALATLTMVTNVAVSFGYMISTISPSMAMANTIAPPLTIPLMLFGGFFLNSGSIPVYLDWLKYLSWFQYANEILVVNQWRNFQNITCTVYNVTAEDQAARCFANGQQVIDSLSFDKDNIYVDFLFLFALFAGYRLIAFFALLLKTKRN